MRRAPHVANPALGVAAAQTDQSREEARERARAREPVVVDAESQVAVGARRIGGKQPAVDVAHRFRVFGRAETVAVLLALARAIAERRRQPEITRAGRERAGARHRETEQRIDALQREVGRVERGCPPEIRAGLKDQRGGIRRMLGGESVEVRRGAGEIAAVQRIESRVQRPWRSLSEQHGDEKRRGHVSAARRSPALPA